MRVVWFGAALALGALAATPANAEIDAVRVGVLRHNICVTDCKNAFKEGGAALDLAATLESPRALAWLGSPHPYAEAMISLSSETSFVSAGLQWRWRAGPDWSIEPSVGYALHDGETINPFANGAPEAAEFAEQHVLLGSRDLFQVSLGVRRSFGERWSGAAVLSHFSHGQILGEGRNQGMDLVAFQVERQLGR